MVTSSKCANSYCYRDWAPRGFFPAIWYRERLRKELTKRYRRAGSRIRTKSHPFPSNAGSFPPRSGLQKNLSSLFLMRRWGYQKPLEFALMFMWSFSAHQFNVPLNRLRWAMNKYNCRLTMCQTLSRKFSHYLHSDATAQNYSPLLVDKLSEFQSLVSLLCLLSPHGQECRIPSLVNYFWVVTAET